MSLSRRTILKYSGVASAALVAGGSIDQLVLGKAGKHGALPQVPTHWQQVGWGGGGFYWATVFDPTRNGVIYMSGDVAGVYKSEDHGRNWRLINNGLPGYAVYALAVDPHSQTVFAGTEQGLCKSTDGGGHWTLLPKTGPKGLHLTAERGRSTDNIAVDPVDGNVVYVGSPNGTICKSTDGGETWKQVYKPEVKTAAADVMELEIGGVNGQAFGGFWFPLKSPSTIKPEDCQGLQFSFQVEGTMVPGTTIVSLTTKDGVRYNTNRNLADLFARKGWQDVFLKAEDFKLDSKFAKANPKPPPTPDWPEVNRLDFVCVNGLDKGATVQLKNFIFVLRGPEGTPVAGLQTDHLVAKDFSGDRVIYTYGNVKLGGSGPGTVQSVTVAVKNPKLVLAATEKHGILMSQDAGKTWRELGTPPKATGIAVAPTDENIMYATFGHDGIHKSSDKGKSWIKCADGVDSGCSMLRVVIAPDNAEHLYAIGNHGWSGFFYRSEDGGTTWHGISSATVDLSASPVSGAGSSTGTAPWGLSTLTDLAINPFNSRELYMSGNWHCVHSGDGGQTWVEADRGADISCIYDIRFHHGRVYACAMDEGTFVSDNQGGDWRSLWPSGYSPAISGHDWRLAVSDGKTPGEDHVVATVSPWSGSPNLVIVSDDSGKTYRVVKSGLPDYVPTVETMWGRGYARALAADPRDPKVLYLGIDGAPSNGNQGGGIFKSEDGGNTWRQLRHQPGDRQMFFGLVVDPTDSRRLYWGCCGSGGGLWRSDDGGESWRHVFQNETWIFNVMVTHDGTVYCPGENLWRSTDHGRTWKQLTHFRKNWTIIGLAADPSNPKTLWFSTTTWDSSATGGVFKTSDGGITWREITGDLPYRKPIILRFDPVTRQLWAGGVGLFKTKV